MSHIKKNFSAIVKEIKRIASPPPPPPGTSPSSPAVSSPAVPSPASHSPSVSKTTPSAVATKSFTDPATVKSISLMQQAIQSLLKTVNVNPEFTNFLFSHYKLSSKTRNRLEEKLDADGVWGKITNNFLLDIGWIAKGVVQALNDFKGVAPNSKSAFRESDFEQMRVLQNTSEGLRKNTKDGEALSIIANDFTEILDKLNYFYETYSRQVMQTETFQDLGNKDKVVLNVGLAPPAALEKYVSNRDFLTTTLPNLTVPGPQNKSVPIRKFELSWLSNPTYFKNFLTQYLKYSEQESENKDVQKSVLDSIVKQISSLVQGPSATQ